MKSDIKILSSSSNEIYTVSFIINEEFISINCNCNAGLVRMLCKHRLNLLSGDMTSLAERNQEKELVDILKNISKTEIIETLESLDKLESDIKKLNNQKSNLKKEIGSKLSKGFDIVM